MGSLQLVKYEATGNDFLLVAGSAPLSASIVRSLCDRHLGVGADGVIWLGPLGGDRLKMELRNADGEVAETSGNGLRSAALCARDLELVASDEFEIVTDAGPRAVRLEGEGRVSVEMGKVHLSRQSESPLVGARAFRVDVGNPHLVLLLDGDGRPPDVAVVGPPLEHSVPGGTNVEVVRLLGVDALDVQTWERGAGHTLACGSGSVAAAAAARAEGVVGTVVEAHNPGGRLLVELEGPLDGPLARLSGPTRRVARVEVELRDLVDDEGHALS